MAHAVLGGKTVLLSGALGSLGRAQAETLGRAGARLLLLDRPDAANGPAFASAIAAKTEAPVEYVGQDLNGLAASQVRANSSLPSPSHAPPPPA